MYIYFIDIVFNRLQSVLNVDNRSVTLSEMTQQNEFYHSPIDIHIQVQRTATVDDQH